MTTETLIKNKETVTINKADFIAALKEFDRQKAFRAWEISEAFDKVQESLQEAVDKLGIVKAESSNAETELFKTVLGHEVDNLDWDGWMNKWFAEWEIEA